MFLFGHLGITLAVFYMLAAYFKKYVDYRWVLLGAIISDIIDKTASLLVFGDPFTYGRTIGHTFLFALILPAMYFVNRKFILLWGGVIMHLLLDNFWTFPQTFLWPFSGSFNTYMFSGNGQWVSSIYQPYNFRGEILGLAFLLYIFFRHKMYKKDNLMAFVKTGKL